MNAILEIPFLQYRFLSYYFDAEERSDLVICNRDRLSTEVQQISDDVLFQRDFSDYLVSRIQYVNVLYEISFNVVE